MALIEKRSGVMGAIAAAFEKKRYEALAKPSPMGIIRAMEILDNKGDKAKLNITTEEGDNVEIAHTRTFHPTFTKEGTSVMIRQPIPNVPGKFIQTIITRPTDTQKAPLQIKTDIVEEVKTTMQQTATRTFKPCGGVSRMDIIDRDKAIQPSLSENTSLPRGSYLDFWLTNNDAFASASTRAYLLLVHTCFGVGEVQTLGHNATK